MAENTKTKFTEGTIVQTAADQTKIGGVFKITPSPAFLDSRAAFFDGIFAQQQAIIAAAEKPDITITLKDGKEIKGKAFETSPATIAKSIFKKLPEKFMAAKIVYSKKYTTEISKIGETVDAEAEEHEDSEPADCCGGHEEKVKYELVDLERPLEGDCTFELIDFESPEGKEVTSKPPSPPLPLSIDDSLKKSNQRTDLSLRSAPIFLASLSHLLSGLISRCTPHLPRD